MVQTLKHSQTIPRGIFVATIFTLIHVGCGGCGSSTPQSRRVPTTKAKEIPTPLQAPQHFLKGQLHLHSARSGDSNTPPQEVVDWYAQHGYDFIVFTDHNDTSTPAVSHPTMHIYNGVELTQNARRCSPPPLEGFACILHINALFTRPTPSTEPPWTPARDASRLALFVRGLQTAENLRGVAMLNHPNFHYAADGDLIAKLVQDHGLRFFELANEAVDSNNTPADPKRPSTAQLWDDVLSRGLTLYATATDDAHHYSDAPRVRAMGHIAHTGDRGFVMVRAAPDEASIRGAFLRGEFYASNGALLRSVRVRGDTLEVVANPDETQTIVWIGRFGRVLHTTRGHVGSYVIPEGSKEYLRAVVTDSRGRTAWTQAVRRGQTHPYRD